MEPAENQWAHVFALVAMQMQLVSAIVAMAPTPEKARETLFQFEQETMALLLKLLPVGRDELSDRLRERATGLISGWYSNFRFAEK